MSDEGQTPANPPAGTPEGTPSSFPTEPAAPVAAAPVEPVIPEAYEFKLPNGEAVDKGFVDALSPVFKNFKFTQDQVNQFMEPYLKYGNDFEQRQEKAFQEFMADTAKKNEAAIRKEWGADFDANLNTAQRGFARFLSADAKKKLDASGLGSDPEFLKSFLAIGKMVQEDQPPLGHPLNSKQSTFADALYGKPN